MARPLPSRDAWFSFNLQLYPGIKWGLVNTMMAPEKMEKMVQDLYFSILPLLGVNRNITKEYRMLPERFGGLGLPDFVLTCFASKVHFMQCNWGFADAIGSLMTHAYEAFLIEVGLYGNIFSLNFKVLGILATDGTWFKHFWLLSWYLNIRVGLHKKYHLQPVREGDMSIMTTFVDVGIATQNPDS